MHTRMKVGAAVAAVALLGGTAGSAVAASSTTSSAAKSTLLKNVAASGSAAGSRDATQKADARTAHALAGILAISDAQGAKVLDELQALDFSPKQYPDNPRFAAIAASLGLTTAQLENVLVQLKQELTK